MTAVVPHPRVELERLYSEHGEQVRAICGSILRNRHEAEDAAQQVFVAALRALGGGTVPRDAAAWLATIARHESWARARRSPASALPESLEDRAQDDPATTVLRQAELAEAWEAIAGLPTAQREALLLREVRGLGYDELAEDLRVSRASVRSLLNRARTTLRMQLERGATVVTGAQWVNVLARLFDSSPAIPSVTRAAAVGLGALAIAGGAVTASTPTHHVGARPTVHRAATSATVRQPVVVSGEDLNMERSPHRAHGSFSRAEGGAHRGDGSGSGSQTSGGDSGGGGSTDGGHDSSGGGGSDATVATSDSSSGTTSSTSGSDGVSSTGQTSGSSSDSGSSGSSGGSGGSDSSGGSSDSGGSFDSGGSSDGGTPVDGSGS
jgi:RNA polymerase sigma factor (sigma-70 family)